MRTTTNRGPHGWWRQKSTPAKVDIYTRTSFWFIAGTELFVAAPFVARLTSTPLACLTILLTLGHIALCCVTVSWTLDWATGSRPQPVRLMRQQALGTVVCTAAFFALAVHAPVREDTSLSVGMQLGAGAMAIGTGMLALGVRTTRRLVLLTFAASAVCTVLGLVTGMGPATSAGLGVGMLLGVGFLVFTAGFSCWLVRAVHELDEARETRTRLAVAEERLRFGRDLHDVLGRNLAVIALKSELAVQLARRERPEAVDQMVEVQRIAQESQREVREVVRGYRGVDLISELAGAQGVLEAAGVSCTVSGTATAAGLGEPLRSALGWVVRETATNVLHHGDALSCGFTLRVVEDRVVLTVVNDGAPAPGTGADGKAGRADGRQGSGLAGLRERLDAVGGTLTAERQGDNFHVVAEAPASTVLSGEPGRNDTDADAADADTHTHTEYDETYTNEGL